jgi:hypothetical protein
MFEWLLAICLALAITAGIFAAAWLLNAYESARWRAFKDDD